MGQVATCTYLRNQALAGTFHTRGAGASACCRLMRLEWSKPAPCRRSGLSAFRGGCEIFGLGRAPGWVCTFCQVNDKKDARSESNHLLRVTGLGLCCQYGLAADGVVSGGCLRGSIAGGEQVSPAQIQFRAGPALRLCRGAGILPAKFNRVSRAQRAASRSGSENEVTARLPSRTG